MEPEQSVHRGNDKFRVTTVLPTCSGFPDHQRITADLSENEKIQIENEVPGNSPGSFFEPVC